MCVVCAYKRNYGKSNKTQLINSNCALIDNLQFGKTFKLIIEKSSLLQVADSNSKNLINSKLSAAKQGQKWMKEKQSAFIAANSLTLAKLTIDTQAKAHCYSVTRSFAFNNCSYSTYIHTHTNGINTVHVLVATSFWRLCYANQLDRTQTIEIVA